MFDIKQSQSLHVPQGATHRIENKSEELLKVMEIQYGSKISEKDIERFEDDYGRVKKDKKWLR